MTRWNVPGRARPDEPLAIWCEAAIEDVCTGRATERHHIIPRGPGSSDEAWNTLDVDGPCHSHIHAHPEWAYDAGFLAHRPPVDTMRIGDPVTAPSPAEARAAGLFTLGAVAVTAAVCALTLALGACAEGDAGQVCRLPNAADCPSDAGGESTPSRQENP